MAQPPPPDPLEIRTPIEQPKMYDGPDVANADVLSIYVVLNGPLNMSPGKSAAQSFHVGWLCAYMEDILGYRKGIDSAIADWKVQGRRVVVRVAETPHVFERVMKECKGVAQRDEGLTEVERGSVTAFATIPYRRDNIPKILTHKRCQLY